VEKLKTRKKIMIIDVYIVIFTIYSALTETSINCIPSMYSHHD